MTTYLPTYLADADRPADLDEQAHAAGQPRAAAAPADRHACPCQLSPTDHSDEGYVELVLPAGRRITLTAYDAAATLPGVLRRVRNANGRATFTGAELAMLAEKADRAAAARAAHAADQVRRVAEQARQIRKARYW